MRRPETRLPISPHAMASSLAGALLVLSAACAASGYTKRPAVSYSSRSISRRHTRKPLTRRRRAQASCSHATIELTMDYGCECVYIAQHSVARTGWPAPRSWACWG